MKFKMITKLKKVINRYLSFVLLEQKKLSF